LRIDIAAADNANRFSEFAVISERGSERYCSRAFCNDFAAFE
jgi:aspartate 1-decarboxylase